MGSPRIHRDELSGGLILAPGSESTASVSEPLADIAGGKSGTEAEIENPYETMGPAGFSGGHGGGGQVAQQQQQQQQQQQADQGIGMHAQPGTDDRSGSASTDQEQTAQQSKDTKDDEYSEQQQAQQASSGCKQS